jgi:hypothetical protein
MHDQEAREAGPALNWVFIASGESAKALIADCHGLA